MWGKNQIPGDCLFFRNTIKKIILFFSTKLSSYRMRWLNLHYAIVRKSNADTRLNIEAAAFYAPRIYTPIPTEIILPSCYFVLFILHFINKKLSLYLVPENSACLKENLSFLFGVLWLLLFSKCLLNISYWEEKKTHKDNCFVFCLKKLF